jgi:HD-GYP domain-containing protein (c-di-GMP phosphodiesterase class II)
MILAITRIRQIKILRGISMYRDINHDPTLINEEKRALKWFLTLFYLVYFSYEIFYHTIYINLDLGLPRDVNYLMYFLLILLYPLSLYLIKRGKVFLVKYVFVISYIIISIINELNIYLGSTQEYRSGSSAEILLILFAPFFINTKFFLVVITGFITKYALFGIILHSKLTLLPLTLIGVISIIGFILLKRFQGYVDAIKISFDKQLDGIVKGVIATIELKDPYTRGHSERVAHYAMSLAIQTEKFSKDELVSFNYACLLHDIGKVNIPDTILMKPGKLSKEEFDVIKTHPKVGADAIIKVDGLSESIGVIKSHHERWDGKGYPEQLEKEEIPLLARIVSVADAFDAMTSSRSYRAAMPVEEAYKRIVEGKGTQFDPEIVDLFVQVFPRWVDYHESYQWDKDSPVKAYKVLEEGTQ